MPNNEILNKLYCAKSHEYVLPEENIAKIGITEHAVEQLGDIVFVEMPEIGAEFQQGEVFGTIESVKAASELYMPVNGKIVEVNESLETEPELVNQDCINSGWIVKIEEFKQDDLKNLMTYAGYEEFITQEEE